MTDDPAEITNGIDEEFENRLSQFGSKASRETKNNFTKSNYPENAPPHAITGKQLVETVFPLQVWIVEGLIPSVGFTAITGAPASYKSFITEYLAICVGSGLPFFGNFPTTQGGVLVIDKENSKPMIKDRLLKLGLSEDPPIHFIDEPDRFDLSQEITLKWTLNFIEDNSIKLIILDSFVHIHRGEENDSQSIVKTFEMLKRLNCAIVFIHHHRKTIKFFAGTVLESIRGSSDIGAELEAHIALDALSDGIRVTQGKNRQGVLLAPFKIVPLITDTSVSFQYAGEIEDATKKGEQANDLILNVLANTPKLTRKEILEMFSGKISERVVSDALRTLEKDNKIITAIEHRNKIYSLVIPEVVEEEEDWTNQPLEGVKDFFR